MQQNLPAPKILVIDDEAGIRDLLSYELGARGFTVATASNGSEAVEKVKKEKFHLAISDVKMPKLGGLETLEAIKKIDPDIEIIMATGYGTIETAVDAMKKGAYDFIQKPFNLEEIMILVEKGLEKNRLKDIIAIYEASKAVVASVNLKEMLPVVLELCTKIARVDDAAVLLIGEEGKLSLAASLGLPNDQQKRTFLDLGERALAKSGQWREPLFNAGPLENDPRFTGIPNLGEIRHALLHPLVVGEEVLGVFAVHRTSEPFLPAEMRSLAIFSSQTAQAAYNARLCHRLESALRELKQTYHRLDNAQTQLVQSEEFATIGQLVSGIAHELNDPLTGILEFAQVLLPSQSLTPAQRKDLESIQTQSQRCRQVIQNLLQHAHRKKSKKEPLHVIALLEYAQHLVKYDFTLAGIPILQEFPESLPPILGDSAQLQQVFLNIISNAKDALENTPQGKLILQASADQNVVRISFKDNGQGIPKENLDKIFTPFFTTKPAKKGTGLGLSFSYGIIQEHGGTISVESQEGKGTTLVIELPIYKGKNPPLENGESWPEN